MPTEKSTPNVTRAPRSAWAAAATLAHKYGNTLSIILTLADTKAQAIANAIHSAAQNLPAGLGDDYAVFNSHATRISPDVLRAATDELEQKEQAEPSHG